MASQPPANLPLLYKDLMPLSSSAHANYKTRSSDGAPWLTGVHAVPLTVDEFPIAQRFLPIVFSVGENPVPLALMGLHEGVNAFLDDEGKLRQELYVPAYIRRYPFMLARLSPEAQELSLCFDPSSELVGDFEEGLPLFEGDKPTETTNTILKFCEDFEMAGQRTTAFMAELVKSGLLMDGEVSIQPKPEDRPFIYRGFQMVDEKKLQDLRGDQLRTMNQNGMLPLLFAHLFSLSLISDVFGKLMQQGKIPQPQQQAPFTAEVV